MLKLVKKIIETYLNRYIHKVLSSWQIDQTFAKNLKSEKCAMISKTVLEPMQSGRRRVMRGKCQLWAGIRLEALISRTDNDFCSAIITTWARSTTQTSSSIRAWVGWESKRSPAAIAETTAMHHQPIRISCRRRNLACFETKVTNKIRATGPAKIIYRARRSLIVL